VVPRDPPVLVTPPVDTRKGCPACVGTSVEFGQCSNLVGCDGTLCSIVYDTGFEENFLVDSPALTIRTADGDLQPGWKMVYPR